MKVHLDTDVGGDPDDACALAMLLGWPGVDLVGITTVADADGLRAAYVEHVLALAGRAGIPVVAGAARLLTTLAPADPVVGDERHWPADLSPRPAPLGTALDLLARSIDAGATVVAIGPQTNLALLAVARPDVLGCANVVAMAGWFRPPAPGLPEWGPEMDFNVQWDVRAAEIVIATAGALTLVTLPATFGAHLRAADLPRLQASGPLGALLASQSAAHAADNGMTELGRTHAALPDDLVNFHYDPVACAVAVGWPGVTVELLPLHAERDGDVLRFRLTPGGRPTSVVTEVDGPAFAEAWLAAVEAEQR